MEQVLVEQQQQNTFRTKSSNQQEEVITALPQSLIINIFLQSSNNINYISRNSFQIPEDQNQDLVYNIPSISPKKSKGAQTQLFRRTKQKFYKNFQEYNKINSLLIEYQNTMLLELKDFPNRRQNKKIIQLRGKFQIDDKENINITPRQTSNYIDDESHLLQNGKTSHLFFKIQPKFLNITLTQGKNSRLSKSQSQILNTPSKPKRRLTTIRIGNCTSKKKKKKGIKVFSLEKNQINLININTQKKSKRISEIYINTKKAKMNNIIQNNKYTKSIRRISIISKQQNNLITYSNVLKLTKNPSISVFNSHRHTQETKFNLISSETKQNKSKKDSCRIKTINSISSSKLNFFHKKM